MYALYGDKEMIEYIELKLLGPLETCSQYLCWPVPARSCRYKCVVCVCLFSLGLQVGVGDAEKQIPLVPIWLDFLILRVFFPSHFFPPPPSQFPSSIQLVSWFSLITRENTPKPYQGFRMCYQHSYFVSANNMFLA